MSLALYYSFYYRKKGSFLFCLFFLLLFSQAASQSEVVLKDNSDAYYISGSLDYYCDTSEQLTIEDISSSGFSHKFRHMDHPYIEHPMVQKNNWIRVNVKNQRSDENKAWYFESWGFDLDEIEFYVSDKKGGYLKTEMGYYKKFSDRTYFHKNFLLHLDIRPGEKLAFYVKVKKKFPAHLTFHIRTGELFIEHAITEYWILGLFYGVFIFIIVVNLYLFLRLKDSVYLFYLFCLLSEVLYCMGRDGLGFQFLWPNFPWVNNLTHHNVTQFLLISSTLLYSIRFLSLRKEQPGMFRLTLVAVLFKSILFLLYYIQPINAFYIFTIDTFLLSIPFISGIISLRRGNEFANYYVIAFSCLFLSFLLIFLNEGKLIPYTDLNWYFINIGMFLEGIFLSIALIDQVRVLRRKNEEAHEKILQQYKDNELLKDKVNQELEEKVQERTNRISELLKKIEQKNEELLASNKELEMLTGQVKDMNAMLSEDNEKLKTDITRIHKSRVLLKDVNFEEFQKVFPDEDSCLKFLSELKWEKGFKCRKCAYHLASTSKSPYGKRCKNCNYDESATTNTLFHKLKFPITKAFYMIYLISTKEKNITLEELSEILSLRKETCWSFRQKIFEAKKNSEESGLAGGSDGWESLALISLNK